MEELKALEILRLQSEGMAKLEIAERVGHEGKNRVYNMNRYMKARGYKRDMQDNYIKSGVECHQVNAKPEAVEAREYITKADIIEIVKNEVEQQLKSGVECHQVGADINIDIPSSKDMRTSIRVNESIWREFQELCNEHDYYKQKDILGMALKEYINKYK